MTQDMLSYDVDVDATDDVTDDADVDFKDVLSEKLNELQNFRSEYQKRVTSMASNPSMLAKMQKFLSDVEQREEALSAESGKLVVSWVYQGGEIRLLDEAAREAAPPAETQGQKLQVVADEPPAQKAKPTRRVWEPGAADKAEMKRRRTRQQSSADDRIGSVELHLLDQSFKDNWVGDGEATQKMVRAFETLATMMEKLGDPPANVESVSEASEEMRALTHVIDRIDEWSELPREVLNRFMHLLAARSRHIQDRLRGRMREVIDPEDQISSFFPRMSHFAKVGNSGFVYGLARDHEPNGNNWLSDANYWWGELQDYLPDDPSGGIFNVEKALNRFDDFIGKHDDPDEVSRYLRTLLNAGLPSDDPRVVKRALDWIDYLEGPEFKALRTACRDFEADDEVEDKDLTLDDWQYINRTRDGVAVLVGGTPKPEAQRRIAEAFGFHDVEWINSKHTRRISGLRDRIDAGTIDFVIFLCRFQDHAADDHLKDTCKLRGVPMAHVTQGYGISRIKLALETGIEATS